MCIIKNSNIGYEHIQRSPYIYNTYKCIITCFSRRAYHNVNYIIAYKPFGERRWRVKQHPCFIQKLSFNEKIIESATTAKTWVVAWSRITDDEVSFCYRVQPDGGRGVYQYDGSDKSEAKSGEDAGCGCSHVRSLLLPGAPDELTEVKLIT